MPHSCLPGLAAESQQALSELCSESFGDDDGQFLNVGGVSDGIEMEWETIPTHLKQDETFLHAVRDIIGTQ